MAKKNTKEKEKEEKVKRSITVPEAATPKEAIYSLFTKSFGAGSIMTLSEDATSAVRLWLHTGSYKLDRWISKGRGLPFGKIVTLIGKKGSGKSTIVAHVLAEAQKMGAIAVLLDNEYAFDRERAARIGVNVDELLISQPDHMEQVFEQIEALIAVAKAHKKPLVIAWDSIAATPSESEVSGEMLEGGHYGEHSKILSAGFRRIVKSIAENDVLLLVVNQIKVNINAAMFQNADTYIGKNPLDFHSHVMIDVREVGKVKLGDEIVGIESGIKITKNRVAAPFKEGSLHTMFENGIDTAWEMLEIGSENMRVIADGAYKSIAKPCSCDGQKVDGKRCEACKGMGVVQDERFKKFYGSQIGDVLARFPGLDQYLLHGTQLQAKEA